MSGPLYANKLTATGNYQDNSSTLQTLKLSGQSPERTVDSGATLVRREDLAREEIRQLLFPDIQKYLKVAQ
jgi:hypothetical protein